jgi:hypothetical protein
MEIVGPFTSWLNVKSAYGAMGDGSSDDTSALQNAINALRTSPQHVLFLPNGTYKITRTLIVSATLGRVLQGESKSATTIQWAGTTGSPMLRAQSMAQTQLRNLTFDGAGKASAGILQAWDGVTYPSNYFNLYEDLLFRDFAQFCLRLGDENNRQDDSGTVRRSEFHNCGVIGVDVPSYNAMDQWVEDSLFSGGQIGVANMYADGTNGGGTFSVRRSVFQNNSQASIRVANQYNNSVRQSISQGSRRFYYATGVVSFFRRILLQGNTVDGVSGSNGPIVEAGDPGPYFLIDNKFNNGAPGPAIVVESGPSVSNVISIGNRFTNTGSIVAGKRLQLDDEVVAGAPVVSPTLPGPPPVPHGKIFEVTEYGTDQHALQQAIDAAVASGKESIVHVPAGIYAITNTIRIPSETDLTLFGDSEATQLKWLGPTGGVMLRIEGPSQATIRNLHFVAGTPQQGMLATAIQQTACNQPGAEVVFDRIGIAHAGGYGIQVNRCDFANVDLLHLSLWRAKVGLGVEAGSSTKQPGRAAVFSSQVGPNALDYEVKNGARLLVEDAYMEHSPHFLRALGNGVPGEITVEGADIKIDGTSTADAVDPSLAFNPAYPGAIHIADWPGLFTLVHSSIRNVRREVQDGTDIVQKGSGPLSMLLLGNVYDNTRAIQISPNARLTQVEDRLNAAFVADNWDGNAQLIRDGLRMLRTELAGQERPAADSSTVTRTAFQNLSFEYCRSCIVLSESR